MSGGGPDRRRVLVSQRVVVDPHTEEARDALAHDWTHWLAGFDITPILVPNALPDPAAMFREFSPAALILTGGGDISPVDVSPSGPLASADPLKLQPVQRRDRTECLLLQAALRERIPILAVCRGMQFINRFLGGRLATHIASPSGTHPAPPGTRHQVRLDFTAAPPALAHLPAIGTVNSYHDHGIFAADLASSLTPLALADDGIVEAFIDRERRILGVQWHPERDPAQPWSTPLLFAALEGVDE